MKLKRNITYKNRILFLLLGLLVFLFIAYKLAIKKTVNIYAENRRIENELSKIEDAPVRIQLIEKRIKEIDDAIGENISLENDLHKQLLEKVGNYCHKNDITLREFPGVHKILQKDYQILTSQFVVEGSFIKILKLIKLLETDYKIGKVASVKFYSLKDPKTSKLSLYARIYIQNIKKNK